jgi:hypothetical protein
MEVIGQGLAEGPAAWGAGGNLEGFDLKSSPRPRVRGRTAAFHHGVVGADDLEMKSWADPHGVGVDQFLHDEGALPTIAAFVDFKWLFLFRCSILSIGFFKLCDQTIGLIVSQPVGRLMASFATRRFVKIVQAIPPFGILANGALNVAGCHISGRYTAVQAGPGLETSPNGGSVMRFPNCAFVVRRKLPHSTGGGAAITDPPRPGRSKSAAALALVPPPA